MTDKNVTLPQLMLIAGTRVALGAGIGLLVADKLNPQARKGAGSALFAVGALTTVPLVMGIMSRSHSDGQSQQLTE
jgi:hypothetical protein